MKLPIDFKHIAISRSQMSRLTRSVSYAALSIMAITMILPLLWLLNGSLQPSWQINADPVIWIPQEWKSVRAGDSERKILLWRMFTDPDSDEAQEVIQIGSRRYTTVIDPTQVQELYSVPRDQLGEAIPTSIHDISVNVRSWSSPEGVKNVVALARDPQQENNLIVAQVEGNENIFSVVPLDLANKGKPETTPVGNYEINVSKLEDGKPIVLIGPESELWVVSSPEIALKAKIIQSSQLGKKELIEVGQTQLPIYIVQGEPADARFVAVSKENWQPLMEQRLLAEKAFVARDENLAPEKETRLFNTMNMIVRTYTPPEGGEPYEVVILTPGSTEYLVISTEYMSQLYTAPITELVEPGGENIATLTYRVQEDFEKAGAIVPSALVGEIQDIAVIIPAEEVKNAFDVDPHDLQRSMRIQLNLTGYQKVLTLKLSGTPFWKFYVNSGYVVLMNMIGHYLSCVLVAYGFARLRAPGKNALFVLLLATMMVPYVIFVLPTYLIFRDIGLLGTMIPLWIRSFFGNAFLIFVLRQFFMTLPYDLDEAAILDGANRWQILWRIILPLSKPALAMVGIFTFWWYWNSFLDPLIYISKEKYYTVTLAMNSFNQLYARAAGYYDRILAGSVLALMPMVLLFLLAQRYFIEGIQMQGLKR